MDDTVETVTNRTKKLASLWRTNIADQYGIDVQEEGKQLLRELNSDIACVAIVGKYRSGKSTFLNLMCNGKPFQTSDDIFACTTGIDVFVETNENGRSIVFMDSEGLFNPEVPKTDAEKKLFALLVSVSSCLIINLDASITSTDFKQLKYPLLL